MFPLMNNTELSKAIESSILRGGERVAVQADSFGADSRTLEAAGLVRVSEDMAGATFEGAGCSIRLCW